MINDNGTPNTAHTMNPGPCILVSPQIVDNQELMDGRLANIAPTLLQLMGPRPAAGNDRSELDLLNGEEKIHFPTGFRDLARVPQPVFFCDPRAEAGDHFPQGPLPHWAESFLRESIFSAHQSWP